MDRERQAEAIGTAVIQTGTPSRLECCYKPQREGPVGVSLESRRPEVYKHSFFPFYYFKDTNNKRRWGGTSYFFDELARQEEKN